jgi:hypothetical protein
MKMLHIVRQFLKCDSKLKKNSGNTLEIKLWQIVLIIFDQIGNTSGNKNLTKSLAMAMLLGKRGTTKIWKSSWQ